MLCSVVWIYCHVIETCCLHLQVIGVYPVGRCSRLHTPKYCKISTRPQSITFQKTVFITFAAIRTQNVTVYWARSTANDNHDFIPFGTSEAFALRGKTKPNHLPRAWPISLAFTGTILLGFCQDVTQASQYFVIDMCIYIGWGTLY